MTEKRKDTVDFAYSFAPPHRMAIAPPDSSDKTLLDLQPEYLRMAWSYDNLLHKPLACYTSPATEWEMYILPEIDDRSFSQSRWTRDEGWMPVLVNTYTDGEAVLRLEAAGGPDAAIVRVEASNRDRVPHAITIRCSKDRQGKGYMGYNPAWIQSQWDPNVLLAGWQDRADRILIFTSGGDRNPVLSSTTVSMAWTLDPGERKTGWLIRPYRAFHSMLPVLMERNWQVDFDRAKTIWRDLAARGAQVEIPDEGIRNGYYAALADCFIMREEVADGTVTACPGTEQYRSPNSFEPILVSIFLDQAGFPAEAAGGIQMLSEQQEPDGCWADMKAWSHTTWGASGMKAWGMMEHYRITQDIRYLAAAFPRMLASSRWQEAQRSRTRTEENGEYALTYGLLPRGMGDCGLWNGDDMYGVFFPHNILAVYADALTVEAARILGREDVLAEVRSIHEKALADLLRAMDRGAIAEEGRRWIPGTPGKTSGSRWGVLYAAFPCRTLPADHELITGTIWKIERRMNAGGQPVGTGWMKDGMWVAITLDNLGETLLARDEGDAAVRYLYSTINHGTPLYSWCEERGQEPGSQSTSGDRQHLWTPVAVGRFVRDLLVMEEDDTLHLARGTARFWLEAGHKVGVKDMRTHFGRVSFGISCDREERTIGGFIRIEEGTAPHTALHIRLPEGWKINGNTDQNDLAGGWIEGDILRWERLTGEIYFSAGIDRLGRV